MRKLLKTPNLVTIVVVSASCFVGVLLDRRLNHRLEGLRHPEPRASVQRDLVVVPEAERRLRERIEVASGLKGRPLLSLDKWTPVDPIVMDGVDVSTMFSGEFIYSASLSSEFRFSGAVVDAIFLRPGTFLDLGIPSGPNTSTVFRFSAAGIHPLRRVGKGALEPLDHTAFSAVDSCSRYEIVISGSQQTVVCNGITRLDINAKTGQQGPVWIASNLTGGEVRELRISG